MFSNVLIKKIASLLILFSFFVYCRNTYSANIIRDSEIEAVVRELARPLFCAAGLDGKRIKVFVVNDSVINAFVMNNNSIFINLGLLRYSTKPYALLGILAHEIAHISAGHVLQMSNVMGYFKSMAIASCVLGLVSGIALDSQVANTVLLGGVMLSTRLFFNYSQEQENIADSYALRYLDESGYDNIGMKEVFNYFGGIEPGSAERYFHTHPLSEKRLFNVQNYNVKNRIKQIPLEQLLKFERIVMKLDDFFTPIHVLSSKHKDDSRYISAIIYYRQGRMEQATQQIDLLAQDDPYLYELKAEVLYKAGRLSDAIESYEKSLKYLSNDDSYLIKLALSRTLLLYGDVKKAILYLTQIISVEPHDILVWKYLSIAYKHDADMGMHYFALTKKAFIEGNLKQFTQCSELAINTLPRDSLYLLQVEDMKNCGIKSE